MYSENKVEIALLLNKNCVPQTARVSYLTFSLGPLNTHKYTFPKSIIKRKLKHIGSFPFQILTQIKCSFVALNLDLKEKV